MWGGRERGLSVAKGEGGEGNCVLWTEVREVRVEASDWGGGS